MSLAMVFSRALDGLEAPEVHVEVQLANGLPSFTLVGLADTEVKESRERVRAALQQSGFAFPHNKRITVNLAPADLPKESGRFDLAIALGILAAAGQLDPARLAACEFAGELSLAGELRPVRGALALALALRRGGSARTNGLEQAVGVDEVGHHRYQSRRHHPDSRSDPEPVPCAVVIQSFECLSSHLPIPPKKAPRPHQGRQGPVPLRGTTLLSPRGV